MRYLSFTLFSFAIMLMFGCSKEELDTGKMSEISDYSLLKVGNQWIYDTYSVDADNHAIYRLKDTIEIVGDTLINGKIFYIEQIGFYGGKSTHIIYEDQESILTYPDQDVLFTLDQSLTFRHYSTRGDDTIAITNYQLLSGTKMIDVPAGQFESLEFKGTVQSFIGPTEAINRSCYTKGVGMTFKRCDFISGNGSGIEQRLVEFHLQE